MYILNKGTFIPSWLPLLSLICIQRNFLKPGSPGCSRCSERRKYETSARFVIIWIFIGIITDVGFAEPEIESQDQIGQIDRTLKYTENCSNSFKKLSLMLRAAPSGSDWPMGRHVKDFRSLSLSLSLSLSSLSLSLSLLSLSLSLLFASLAGCGLSKFVACIRVVIT